MCYVFFGKRDRIIFQMGVLVVCLLAATNVLAQKQITCSDGVRYEIDFVQISIQYQGTTLSGTLSGLSALGARVKVEPKTLQIVATATQQWNEFLKGLVAGYNSCAITKGLRKNNFSIFRT